MYNEDTHTLLSCGGDIDSEQQLAAHVIRRESTTQAVADQLIAAHTHTYMSNTSRGYDLLSCRSISNQCLNNELIGTY